MASSSAGAPVERIAPAAVRIAKPLLLVITPIGVIGGLWEAYRHAGGLVFLMTAMLVTMSCGIGMVVYTIRREKAERQRERDGGGDTHN